MFNDKYSMKRATKFEMIRFQLKVDVIISAFAREKPDDKNPSDSFRRFDDVIARGIRTSLSIFDGESNFLSKQHIENQKIWRKRQDLNLQEFELDCLANSYGYRFITFPH